VYEHGRGFAYRWGWFATGPGHGYHTPRNTPVPWAGRLVVPYNKQISSFKFSSTLTIKEPVEDFRFQRTEGTLRYTVENLEYPSETVTGEERVHGPDYRIGSYSFGYERRIVTGTEVARVQCDLLKWALRIVVFNAWRRRGGPVV